MPTEKEILQELLIKPTVPITLYRIEEKLAAVGLDQEDIITLIKRYSTLSRSEIRKVLNTLKAIESKIIKAELKKREKEEN